MNTCSICGKLRECQDIVLEGNEGAVYGLPDGTVFHYCPACWRLLHDKRTAASLLQGQTVNLLRALGHRVGPDAMRQFHDRLMTLGKREKP